MGFEGEPDIDVQKIFERLIDDTFMSVGLCEGCELIAVGRINNTLKVQYIDGGWEDYERPLLIDKEDPEDG